MVDVRDTADTLGELKERGARRMALLIAALAALLAVIQTIGDNAAQDALKYNIDASNLWSFYQAKTIRQTSAHGGRDAGGRDRRPAARAQRSLRQTRRGV